MAYLEQSTRYIPYDTRFQGRYRYFRPSEVLRVAARHAVRRRPRRAVRHLPRAAREDDGVGARALPEGTIRLRLRLQADDQGQGVRHGARHPARGDHLERRCVRNRSGVRGAAAAHARAPAAGSADLRAADARGAAQGHPVVPHAGRSTRPRRRVDRLPREDPRRHRGASSRASSKTSSPSPRPMWPCWTGIPTAKTRCSRRSVTRTPICPKSQLLDRVRAVARRRPDRAGARVRRRPDATGGTSPGARSNARRTGSTSSATTARSATSSATAC